jgi:ribose/xylose/arabinose/galactoside ABC-type transport system permease subunit
MEVAMAAIAKFLARGVFTFGTDANIIKQFALFCAAGLLVSLLILSYGLDLSPGFF